MRQAGSGLAWCAALAFLTAGSGGCRPTDSSDVDASAILHDGAWMMTVDRALRDGRSTSGSPTASLSDSDYAPVSGIAGHRFEVSEHQTRIAVAEPRLVGRLDQTSTERLSYTLVEGAWAGGRIVIWRTSGSLQCELTLYGSGAPFASSERGSLREAR